MHAERMEQPEKCVDETVRMIKQKEKDQRWRKWINLSGTGILFFGLLFSLWAVRQVQWEELWLLPVIRIVLVVGFGTAMRCWRYILEQWYLRSRPFGIWHSPHSYVMAAMELAGAVILGKAMFSGHYVLSLIVGGVLLIGALLYYAYHEAQINGTDYQNHH